MTIAQMRKRVQEFLILIYLENYERGRQLNTQKAASWERIVAAAQHLGSEVAKYHHGQWGQLCACGHKRVNHGGCFRACCGDCPCKRFRLDKGAEALRVASRPGRFEPGDGSPGQAQG